MLIAGIGTDIVEIERIKKAVAVNGERFLKRIFTDAELNFCLGKKDPYPSLAARFAAKEAVFKSLGTGLGVCSWKDVEVMRSSNSAPEIILGGNAVELAERDGVIKVFISISHDRGRAVAYALAVKGDV